MSIIIIHFLYLNSIYYNKILRLFWKIFKFYAYNRKKSLVLHTFIVPKLNILQGLAFSYIGVPNIIFGIYN